MAHQISVGYDESIEMEPMEPPRTLVLHPSTSQKSNSSARTRQLVTVERKGTFEQHTSFKRITFGPQTPKLAAGSSQAETHGPASKRTVIIVAGLFCVSLMFILSGIIVLLTENNAQFSAMRTTAWVFIGFGCLMLLVCGLLQRENWSRYMDQIDADVYFLHLGKNPIWKLVKFDYSDLIALGYVTAQTSANEQQKREAKSSSPVDNYTNGAFHDEDSD